MSVHPFGVRGTPERVWAAWAAPSGWPVLDIPSGGHAVVVSPHPDDETLGVGGTIVLLHRAGWTVDVVAVTDGEASHPPSPARDAAALAAERRAEQTAALDLLGVPPLRLVRLGVPDGNVAAHVGRVAERLRALVSPGDWLIAPWTGDGHRDHEAAGRAAQRVAAAVAVRLWSYPVWAWHWAAPDHPVVATWRPTKVELPPAARQVKAAALACYRSQTTPQDAVPGAVAVVPPSMIAHHRRAWEVLLA